MYKVTAYYKENPAAIDNICKKSNYTWTEHLYYTRNAIVSILADLPDQTAITTRLLKNQDDIGAVLAPYHSTEQVAAFVDILKRHIAIAAEFVAAAKAGTDTAPIKARLASNGNDVVSWMAAADPMNWPASKIEPLWTEHLNTTIAQVEARVAADWTADIAALDAGHACIDQFSHVFCWGLVYNNIHAFSTKIN